MRAYLDHAADTPQHPLAVGALLRWSEGVGNPSSAHASGQALRVAVETARERIAAAVGAQPGDVVFTSGGTEADNLAIKGIVWAAAQGRPDTRPHLVVTAVEHEAVLQPAQWLADTGTADLTVVPVQADGRVAPERVLDAVRSTTALVSVMAANNVVGAVNDVAAIGAALAERDVAFHVDAVQALRHLDVDVAAWHADALALSAHKFGGPPGVGVAVLRRGVPVTPLLHGGGQDRGVRSGTMSAALDAACGVAVELAVAERPLVTEHVTDLAGHLAELVTAIDGVRRLGPSDPAHRLPSHVTIGIEGVTSDALVYALDEAGVQASAGPACASGASAGNPVLAAMGVETDASLRLTIGPTTTFDEVAYAGAVLADVIPGLRHGLGGTLRRRREGSV